MEEYGGGFGGVSKVFTGIPENRVLLPRFSAWTILLKVY